MSSHPLCPVNFADPDNPPEGEFRLPPESADLDADFRALRDAAAATSNADQWAAVQLRAHSLRGRVCASESTRALVIEMARWRREST